MDIAVWRMTLTSQTVRLRDDAHQADAAGASTVFVVTQNDQQEAVVAYYAWCMAAIEIKDAPARLAKGAGAYPQPVALLTRLGADIRHERKGLRAALMKDMFTRLVSLSSEIGCRGLLVHCETPQVRQFGQHLIPEFMQSPTDELHLMLLMKDIHKTLQ